MASTVANPVQEAQPHDPLPLNQSVQSKELEVSKETSSDKAAEVPQGGAASQGFEQALALVTMPAEEAPKDKEEMVPPAMNKLAGKTSKDKI